MDKRQKMFTNKLPNLFSWRHFGTWLNLWLIRLVGDVKIYYFSVEYNLYLFHPFLYGLA